MQTILIVDSPSADATILASALRVEGFDVVLAASAAEAWQRLEEKPVVLTVVDLMLKTEGVGEVTPSCDVPVRSSETPIPVRNGLEFAREIRMKHPAMRVLLTSAYHLSERQLERADCGVSGFIPKPYDLSEVIAFIRAKVSGPPSSRRIWMGEARSAVRERTGDGVTTPDKTGTSH